MLPFDRIVIVTTAGAEREVTLDWFLQLDLTERVRLILERRVEFHSGRTTVPVSTALRAIFEAQR